MIVNPHLKELCIEIVDGDIESDRFTELLIETGVDIESFEWDIIGKLLGQGDKMKDVSSRLANSLH